MKNLKLILCSLFMVTMIASCSSGEKETKTVIIEKPAEKEDDNGIGFEINTDKNGKVSGGISGKIETK